MMRSDWTILEFLYLDRLRRVKNKTMPRTVIATASTMAQREYGPAPNIIGGKGITHIRVPKEGEAPDRMAVIMMKIIPMKIKRKPTRNSLKGSDHEGASNIGGISRFKRL